MKIVRFRVEDYPKYGIVEDGSKRVIGIKGDPLYTQVEPSGEFYELEEIRLLSPTIPRSKVVCCTNNAYWDRIDEITPDTDLEDDKPRFIIRPNTAVIGPNDPVMIPAGQRELLVSTQLGAVAKTLVRDAKPAQAKELIAGYVGASVFHFCGQDPFDKYSANCTAWDNSVALGPSLVVEKDFQTRHLDMLTYVEKEEKQVAHSGHFRWSIEQIFAEASRLMTLLPGDIVLIGTQNQLAQVHGGQIVTSEIQPIGEWDNRILAA